MARAIERIERDLQALEEAIQAIAQELQSTYTTYLTSLGQAVRHQLILASYHLCTQGYPESFLNLSLSQRQHLQQAIRKLGQNVVEQLIALTKMEEVLQEETQQEAEAEAEASQEQIHPLQTSSVSISPAINQSNPVEIAKWQQALEKKIQLTLKIVSREANLLLQKAGILPKKLPEPILEAAAIASEASAEVVPGPPNLLNLVIEVEGSQQPQSEEGSLTQIMAVNMRLGEIEFADPTLSSSRKQIRGILVQLQKLGQEYQKKQRERSIAEAEAAWRASWYED